MTEVVLSHVYLSFIVVAYCFLAAHAMIVTILYNLSTPNIFGSGSQ